jgi:hypothetical protein
MSLNDTKIRSLKPSAKPFKVSDSHGLYLLVNPGGSRLWYLKYRMKESRLGLGSLKCLWLMLANSVTVSVSCWRRISIQHNSALLKEPLLARKNLQVCGTGLA